MNDSPQRRKGREGKADSVRDLDDDVMTCEHGCQMITPCLFSDFPSRSLRLCGENSISR
jgi:hypothetical protein